jgi:hypothetical protein
MITAEQEKQDRQNDKCASFEEGNPEQALVLQQDAQPPGRHRGARAAANLDVDGEKIRQMTFYSS